jgi:hypothetical protein
MDTFVQSHMKGICINVQYEIQTIQLNEDIVY